MADYHPDGELAPRDVVARSIMAEVRRQGGETITLDLRARDRDYAHERFPMISATLKEHGLDLGADPIPVLPAAHYCMGGVETDRWGRTSLPGLYAAGEVACNGVHGANRLASNSLLEGLVYGARCGEVMVDDAPTPPAAGPPAPQMEAPPRSAAWIERKRLELTETMWRAVGIERCEVSLLEALRLLRKLRAATEARAPDRAWLELGNMAVAGEAVASFALRRRESRGGHFRTDHPDTDDSGWRRHQVLDASQW